MSQVTIISIECRNPECKRQLNLDQGKPGSLKEIQCKCGMKYEIDTTTPTLVLSIVQTSVDDIVQTV